MQRDFLVTSESDRDCQTGRLAFPLLLGAMPFDSGEGTIAVTALQA